MSNIVVLDPAKHRDLRVRATPSAAYGDAQKFVQVVIREFPMLAVHYPILFSKDSETGAFFCGAMMGFEEGENLFLGAGGIGQDSYRPLNLQRGPFFVAGDGLAIDLDSPRIAQFDGEALFDEAGEATPYLESVAAVFRELRPGIEMTRMFIARLLELQLIEPIEIDLSFDDGERRSLEGLYTINPDAVRELEDETVLDLFKRGYLQLIYLVIASLKQVPVLAREKNSRL